MRLKRAPFSAALACSLLPSMAHGQSDAVDERLEGFERRLQQLERELALRDEQIRADGARIRELESRVAGSEAQAAGAPPAMTVSGQADPAQPAVTIDSFDRMTGEQRDALTRTDIASLKKQADGTGGVIPDSMAVDPKKQEIAATMAGWGSFAAGRGFTLAKTEYGEMNFSAYTQIRYVNQVGTDDTFTDRFGVEKPYKSRQDITLNKQLLWFTGWVADPKLRYAFTIWTSQALQGQTGNMQTIAALTYVFDKTFALSAGVSALPAVHTNMGNWPLWMGAERNIGDDYLKPGYTQGIWAEGRIAPRLFYKVVLGNNINTVAIDPSQLDRNLNTISGALWWMPTTGEWGPRNGALNDYEQHEEAATLFGVAYTHSREQRASVPGGGFENFAIRLSDGTAIFVPNALEDGTTVDRVTYDHGSAKAGWKYRGLSLFSEYQWRALSDFTGTGVFTRRGVWDQTVQLNVGYFVLPKKAETYLRGSYIFGELRDSYDAALGVNWFPIDGNRNIRLNGDVAYLYRSPVGSQSYPWQVGITGFSLNANLEVLF
jgi:hypothetical protein